MTSPLRSTAAALFLAATVLVASPAHAAVPRDADVGSTNGYSRTAFQATNAARARNDLRALAGNACLRKAALRQARTIAADGALSHQDLGRIQRDCGVGWVGENVAAGYTTGRSVVDGWMGSEGHRANILSRNYTHMGIAAVKRDGRWWAAQVFGSR